MAKGTSYSATQGSQVEKKNDDVNDYANRRLSDTNNKTIKKVVIRNENLNLIYHLFKFYVFKIVLTRS